MFQSNFLTQQQPKPLKQIVIAASDHEHATPLRIVQSSFHHEQLHCLRRVACQELDQRLPEWTSSLVGEDRQTKVSLRPAHLFSERFETKIMCYLYQHGPFCLHNHLQQRLHQRLRCGGDQVEKVNDGRTNLHLLHRVGEQMEEK